MFTHVHVYNQTSVPNTYLVINKSLTGSYHSMLPRNRSMFSMKRELGHSLEVA